MNTSFSNLFVRYIHVTGAHDADRTRDLVLTKDVLYQLSYVGHLVVRYT